MSYFDFKQFRIYHDRCAMKVGTDGVLLGAWADLSKSKRILDVGCGCGLISLMAAQRSQAEITGIDIDACAAEQAEENVKHSPFASRIQIASTDILRYNERHKFDTIISNPPFFIEDTLSPNTKRSIARHASSLHFEDLISKCVTLMSPEASLQIIIPSLNVKIFRDLCTLNGLSLLRKTDVLTKQDAQPKRTLLHFIKTKGATKPQLTQITLLNRNGEKTLEYTKLTQDFYL